MKRSISFVLSLCMAICLYAQQSTQLSEFHPQASEDAMVIFGKARFTVLTPRLVRMEWAEDSRFEDRATLGMVNRALDIPVLM